MAISELDPNAAGRADPKAVRQRANRRAESFEQHDAVHREIGSRLLEHLDPVRIEPRRVLELGAATGRFTERLENRYSGAEIVGLDFAHARLAIARARRRRWRDRRQFLCADARALPLATDSVDLVCGNLLMHWIDEPARLMRECARALRHGGLLAFSALGPDSLMELRPLLPVGPSVRLHPFADMHQLADLMVSTGFSDVVADMELLNAQYRGTTDLLSELRMTGSTCCAGARCRSLGSASALRRLLDTPTESEALNVTFEVVYLHGWYLDRRSVEVPSPSR